MGGLFFKFTDLIPFVHVHDTEASGLLHGDLQYGDGHVGACLFVIGKHLGVVHLVDVVAGEDQNIFRIVQVDETDVLVNGVGSTLVPDPGIAGGGIGREHMNTSVRAVQIPGLSVS